MEDVSNVL